MILNCKAHWNKGCRKQAHPEIKVPIFAGRLRLGAAAYSPIGIGLVGVPKCSGLEVALRVLNSGHRFFGMVFWGGILTRGKTV
jgi:hypothetical protein